VHEHGNKFQREFTFAKNWRRANRKTRQAMMLRASNLLERHFRVSPTKCAVGLAWDCAKRHHFHPFLFMSFSSCRPFPVFTPPPIFLPFQSSSCEAAAFSYESYSTARCRLYSLSPRSGAKRRPKLVLLQVSAPPMRYGSVGKNLRSRHMETVFVY